MYCCISECTNITIKNKHKSKDVKFYYFPRNNAHMPWLCEKRQKWINAVKKHTKHPNDWLPRTYTTICSAHFIGNKKSENPLHPSYVPTIFPGVESNPQKLDQKLKRFERHQHRIQKDKFVVINTVKEPLEISIEEYVQPEKLAKQRHQHRIQSVSEVNTVNTDKELELTEANVQPEKLAKQTVGCQSDDLSEGHQAYDTHLFCSLMNVNGICSAETQTNIASKVVAHKSCDVNIPKTTQVMKDFSCDPLDQQSQMLLCQGFHGISSLKTEENLISSTGVTFAVFDMLLNLLPDTKSTNIDKKTKLLITLMKLKTGLCFSVLSIIFQIHRTTISRIFENSLFLLHSALKKFIIWPSKKTVQANMPEPFKLHYANTRVIIDCTEVHTEYPPTVKQRVHMYSDYKHGYTIKFLVGCTPCGFISFVSKCYGGRSSDCFITNDCGLIDLLEPGDTVLADKGFPSIKTGVENKKAVLVMPPFLHAPQFSSQEVDETYKIASVRIHIERIMQRIKQFHIFDKMPISLLKYRDEIVFTICALVNVENPIIKQ